MADAQSISPSSFSSSNNRLFESWMAAANIVVSTVCPSEIQKLYENLTDTSIPCVVKDLASAFFQSNRQGHQFFAQALRPISLVTAEQGDENLVEYKWIEITRSFADIVGSVQRTEKELVQRHGIDSLYRAVFVDLPVTNKPLDHCFEKTIALVEHIGTLEKHPSGEATIDAAIFTQLDADVITSLIKEANQEVLKLLSISNRLADFGRYLVHPIEYKRAKAPKNERQLIMDLSSAQAFNAMLDIHVVIFGCSISQGKVTIYSSDWTTNKSGRTRYLIYGHKEKYDLCRPDHILHFHAFLCNLSRYIVDHILPQLHTLTSSKLMSVLECKATWKAPEPMRKSTKSGPPATSSGSGTNDTDVPMEGADAVDPPDDSSTITDFADIESDEEDDMPQSPDSLSRMSPPAGPSLDALIKVAAFRQGEDDYLQLITSAGSPDVKEPETMGLDSHCLTLAQLRS